jgi:hypothetical protein
MEEQRERERLFRIEHELLRKRELVKSWLLHVAKRRRRAARLRSVSSAAEASTEEPQVPALVRTTHSGAVMLSAVCCLP